VSKISKPKINPLIKVGADGHITSISVKKKKKKKKGKK
jgi:hypothetical protein